MAGSGINLGNAYVSVSGSFDGLGKGIAKQLGAATSSGGKQITSGLGGAFKTVGKIGAGAIGVAAGALSGIAAKGGINRALQIENAQAKLTGLGHSAKDTSAIMADALKSVKGTAYGLGDAATVAAQLSAAGVKSGTEMQQNLKAVADTAAISGRSLSDIGTIFGSVAARGKLQGDDMLQLMSSGVPVLQLLSKQTGKSSAEISAMVSKGQIDFATFSKAMEAGMGGAAQASGKTFTGALDNVKAALGRLGANAATPVLASLKDVFNASIPAIDGFNTALTPAFKALDSGLSKVTPAITAGIGKLPAAFTTVSKKVTDLKASFSGMGAGMSAGLVGALVPLAGLLPKLAGGLPLVGGKLAGLLGPLKMLTGPVGIVAGLFVSAAATSSTFRASIGTLLSTVGASITTMGKTLMPVVQNLATTLMPVLQTVFQSLVSVVTRLVVAFTPLIAAIFPLLGRLIASLMPAITSIVTVLGAALVGIISRTMPLITTAIQALIPILIQVVSAILPVAVSLINALVPVFSALIGAIAPLIPQLVGALLPVLVSLVQTVLPVVVMLLRALAPVFTALIVAIAPIIPQLIGALMPVFMQLVTSLLPPILSLIRALAPVFVMLVAAIAPLIPQLVSALLPVILQLVRMALPPLTMGIRQVGTWFTFLVNNVLIPYVLPILRVLIRVIASVVSTVISMVGAVVSWFVNFKTNAMKPISDLWAGIKRKFSDGKASVQRLAGNMRDSVMRVFSDFKKKAGDIFGKIVDVIGKAWDGIKNVVKAPIRFVVNTVINDGIVSAIRKIQGFFGVKGKNQLQRLSLPKGFRAGGPTGNVGVNDVAGVVHGREFVMDAKTTRRAGGAAGMEAIRRAVNSGAMPGFKSGGYVGGSGRLTALASSRINAAAQSLGWILQMAQLGWRPHTSYSGTSHQGDAVDVSGPAGGTRLWSIRDALRRQNWAAWVRGPKQNYSWHVHAIPLAGAGTAAGSALYQRQAYAAGGDGLHGMSTPDVYAKPSGSGGSWLSQAVSAVVSFADQMKDKAKSVFGAINPMEFIKSKFKSLSDSAAKGIGGGGWGATLAKLPMTLMGNAVSWARGKWDSFIKAGDQSGTPGKSGNAESWRSMVAQALKITGIGGGKSDEDKWLRQIMSESSGNPNLIQSSALRDINVRNGDPARGLVQVPGVTWADFGKDQGPFLSNWMNPLKNLIVGMRAAFAQHGGARWRNVIGFGHGYAGGTSFVPFDMLSPVGERGMELIAGPQVRALQRGSQVLSNADTRALLGGSSGPMRVTGQLDITEDGKATLYGWMVDAMEDRESMMARIGA